MKKYSIKNRDLEVALLSYGATVQSLKFRGVDVALGFDTLEEYQADGNYLGSTVGRNANRIPGAKFTLNGKEYRLSQNNGDGHHHGGFLGLSKKEWAIAHHSEDAITFQIALADGEEGYPGNMEISVTYALADAGLEISYRAQSDADTVFNPTNHTYFNLSGCGAPTIEDHLLWIDADAFTPLNETLDTTGEIRPVEGTPFDFRIAHPIGARIREEDEQIRLAHGYDQNFCLNGEGYRRVASAYSPISGIRMDCYTDRPGLHLYTATGLETKSGKTGPFSPGMAFCLETQCYPCAILHPHFPSPVLRAGEIFESTTAYHFMLEK